MIEFQGKCKAHRGTIKRTEEQFVGTHHYMRNDGIVMYGRVLGPAFANNVWFLPLCNDGKTWMKEPVCACGVIANAKADFCERSEAE